MNQSKWKPDHLSIRTATPILPLLLLGALLSHLIQFQVACLRISSIAIPAAVWNGSQATLSCNYQLARGEQLYSVKWYKDYVEFYRFQLEPSGSSGGGGGPSATLAADGPQQHGAAPSNSKNEFELDGINLDLSKSNGTHVHLRQVSLATEATFKCEVSADSPTFATVSQERQMKVYVLPKQKLIVSDNNNNNNNNNNINQGQPLDYGGAGLSGGLASSSQRPPVYQLNDLINVTCVSGPSRPGAQLSWLLNEIPLTLSADQTVGPFRWRVSQTSSARPSNPNGDDNNNNNNHQLDLIETQSTLTLMRVQQDNLVSQQHQQQQHGSGKTNTSNHNSAPTTILGNQSFGGGLHPIRLRCVAKLSVEYLSETSILVSSGKTLIKRRQQQQPASMLPTPSSLIEDHSARTSTSVVATTHGDHTTGPQVSSSRLQADDYPIYRWPRPPPPPATPARQRHKTAPSGAGQYLLADPSGGGGGGDSAWPASPVAPSIGLESSQATDQASRSSSSSSSPSSSTPLLFARRQVAVVWANRQLRAQAEFIEQLLRRLRPNELEPPIIEAKLAQQQRQQLQQDDDAPIEHDANYGDDDDDAAPSHAHNVNSDSDESTIGAAPSDEVVQDDQLATRVTPGVGDESATTTTMVPLQARSRKDGWTSASISSRSLTATSSFAAADNHELNDRFEFTCTPQISPAEQTESTHSVHLKWLINDKEITSKHINAFDGSRFFFDNNLRPWSSSSGSSQSKTQSKASVETIKTQSTALEGITLTVELTPSLLQLKEINLKCRTIVEQPLIEYESQFVATIATSPFIQADSRFRPPNNANQRGSPYIQRNRSQGSSASGSNNNYGDNSSNVQRTRHKGTVYKLRTFQASSSASDTHGQLFRSDYRSLPTEMTVNLIGAVMMAIYVGFH